MTYKHELRAEIAQLKEDLFKAIDNLPDGCELQHELLIKYPEWYHWYFEREAEAKIMRSIWVKERPPLAQDTLNRYNSLDKRLN